MRCLLISLALWSLGSGNTVTSPTPRTDIFSEAELRCFLDQKVLHSDGKCYTLKQTGPCLNDEWLVLDKNRTHDSRRLVCRDLPCTRAYTIYWPKDGQCHKPSDKKTLCPYAGNVLASNSYGEGECACEELSARFMGDVIQGMNTTEEWEGVCYPLHRREPCPEGKVLLPVYMEGQGVVGACGNDPCRSENSAKGEDGFALWEGDGRCHRLGTRGACAQADQLFNVHPQSYQPECYNTVNSLYGDSALRCEGNVNLTTMMCQEKLVLKMQNNPFVIEVTRGRRVKRKG